jgi:hypothetical protein
MQMSLMEFINYTHFMLAYHNSKVILILTFLSSYISAQ